MHTDKSLQEQHQSHCDSNLKKAKTSALMSLKNIECLPCREKGFGFSAQSAVFLPPVTAELQDSAVASGVFVFFFFNTSTFSQICPDLRDFSRSDYELFPDYFSTIDDIHTFFGKALQATSVKGMDSGWRNAFFCIRDIVDSG